MSVQEYSKFHVYSLGTVAEDKPEGTFIVKLIADESNNLFNDKLDETDKEHEIKTKDRNDVEITSNIEVSQTIEAEWIGLGFGGNRATAPDVKQGEKVLVYRYADEDKYFWEVIYTEHALRRLERVVYLFGGNPVPPGELNNSSNSYWILISTLDKLIKLHTSSSNGEPYEWDLAINTGEGMVSLTDNNSLELIFDANTQTVRHNTGDLEEFNNRRTNINSPGGINMNGVTIDGSGNMTIPGSLSVKGNITAGGSILATGRVTGSNIY